MASPSGGMAVRGLFGLLGLGVGIVGGWVAYDRTGSVWLAVFVGLMAANYIGRGIADVITDPQKGRRFVFFTLPLVFAVGGLAGAYLVWDAWWIAVIVGFVFYVMGYVVATVMFPAIAGEEAADTMSRMGGKQRPSYADDDARKPSYADDVKRLPSIYDKTKQF
jgi:hypothetical protein